jgi:hypothetical protein
VITQSPTGHEGSEGCRRQPRGGPQPRVRRQRLQHRAKYGHTFACGGLEHSGHLRDIQMSQPAIDQVVNMP